MIKIIKHGNKHYCKCKNCGCEFTCEKSDLEKEDWGRNEWHDVINCPDCNERIIVR